MRTIGRWRGVFQSRVGHPKGDCYRAAIATVFSVPIEAVPDIHYELDEWTPMGSPQTKREQSEIIRVTFEWDRWFATLNLIRLRVGVAFKYDGAGQVTIGTVNSASGPWHHAVVCCDGEIVWDPNPAQMSYDLAVIGHELWALCDPRRPAGRPTAELATCA